MGEIPGRQGAWYTWSSCWTAPWAVGSWNTRWERWWWWWWCGSRQRGAGSGEGGAQGRLHRFRRPQESSIYLQRPGSRCCMWACQSTLPPRSLSLAHLSVFGMLVVCPRWAHASRAQARTKGANRAAIRASSQVAPYPKWLMQSIITSYHSDVLAHCGRSVVLSNMQVPGSPTWSRGATIPRRKQASAAQPRIGSRFVEITHTRRNPCLIQPSAVRLAPGGPGTGSSASLNAV